MHSLYHEDDAPQIGGESNETPTKETDNGRYYQEDQGARETA